MSVSLTQSTQGWQIGTFGTSLPTFGSTVAAGDQIVVWVGCWNTGGGTCTGVTDNASGGSNSYSLVYSFTSGTRTIQCYLATNTLSQSSLAITPTKSVSGAYLLSCAFDYASTYPFLFDQGTGAFSGTGTKNIFAPDSSTLLQSVEVATTFMMFSSSDNESLTPSPVGFTLRGHEYGDPVLGAWWGSADEITVSNAAITSPGFTVASNTSGNNPVGLVTFTTSPLGYNVSGTVKDSSGTAIAGVTVSWTGTASGSTTTASDGTWTAATLANGSYTFTPTETGWTFSPSSTNETVSGSAITGVNFTGVGYVIKGTCGVASGVVSYSGAASGSVTADGSGNYVIPGLANGAYTVTPSDPANVHVLHQFTPGSIVLYVNSADVTYNFSVNTLNATSNYTVAGNAGAAATSLTTSAWNSYPGAPIVVLCNAATITGISDLAGNTYVNCTAGLYYCAASKGNGSGGQYINNTLTITFTSQTYATLETDELQYAVPGTFAWSGVFDNRVMASGSNTYIDSDSFNTPTQNAFAIITASNTAAQTASSGRGGLAIYNSKFGGYQNAGYAFFSSVQTGTTIGFNFPGASYPSYLTMGLFGWYNNHITGNCGVGGATITFTGGNTGTVTADAGGNYSLLALSASSTTITPTATGITFSPTSRTVTPSTSADTSVSSFTASLNSPMSGVAVTYTVTDTTIVGTWTTPGPCDSNIWAGAKAGLDNGQPKGESSHYAIVTGLLPSTTYTCYVQSLGSNSATKNVTTAAAQARILVSGATEGSTSQISGNLGDTTETFVSNDNKTYITENDGYGFGAAPYNLQNSGNGYAIQLWQLSNDSTFTGAGSALITAYGVSAEEDGTDGPLGDNMSNKSMGLIGLAGNLFLSVYRQYPPTYSTQLYGNIIKSTDHGATWNNFTTPTTLVAGGSPILPHAPGEPYQGYNYQVSLMDFVLYGADDGTLGYNTAGNQIDGGNGYIYIPYALGGAGTYMMRVSRVQFNAGNLTSPQYWVGPTSPVPADFTNDSNWSSTPSGLTDIFNTVVGVAGGVSWPHIVFVPGLNCYIWSWANSIGGSWANRTQYAYCAPTPAGPWTLYYSHNTNPNGFYGYFPMHRDVINNTAQQNVAIRWLFTGDPNTSSIYKPTVSTITLTTSAYNITGNAGVGGATISYSGTASGSVTADSLGNYTIPGLANGPYTIRPSLAGKNFKPLSQNVTVSNANISGVNFSLSSGTGDGLGSSFRFRF